MTGQLYSINICFREDCNHISQKFLEPFEDIEVLPHFGVILAIFWGNSDIFKITDDTAAIQQ